MKNGTRVVLLKDYSEEGAIIRFEGDLGTVMSETGTFEWDIPNCVGVKFDNEPNNEMAHKISELKEWTGTVEDRDKAYPKRKRNIIAEIRRDVGNDTYEPLMYGDEVLSEFLKPTKRQVDYLLGSLDSKNIPSVPEGYSVICIQKDSEYPNVKAFCKAVKCETEEVRKIVDQMMGGVYSLTWYATLKRNVK